MTDCASPAGFRNSELTALPRIEYVWPLSRAVPARTTVSLVAAAGTSRAGSLFHSAGHIG
jgi:hypothetical protein